MKSQNDKVSLHPVISSVQKIAVYETKTKIYIVGSNNPQNSFRVIKLDRSEPRELVIIDDGVEYTTDQIRNLVWNIDGNRNRIGSPKSTSAFGIVGFVRFMEGYYLILVTRRRRVAAIGLHYIYKIEHTTMIYIPHDSVRIPHPDEARYLKMFQSIDLSSNFYFSYSYDITHTVQVNFALPENLLCLKTSRSNEDRNGVCNEGSNSTSRTTLNEEDERINSTFKKIVDYAIRSKPNSKFVWNSYLLSKVENILDPNWVLYIMHGFVSQSNISIFGRSLYITLIARRSNKYAGTRFLKRGANFDGDVANEVETEQIVEDLGVRSVDCPRISSFVQMRGSIPGHWSQDITKLVPKPTIAFDLSDPYAITAGKHFNQLFERYGSPIIVLNLVKQREKKKHESTLSEQYSSDIKYLNQFLPPQHTLQYITFDMARKNKGKFANVMGRLGKIAQSAITKTGVYCSYPESPQTGVIRVNCVDCLDRTNTAQFALGKCALKFQLTALGVIGNSDLNFDSDCIRLLETLYEDHGDTLALQYGGSQLVHRIKTYRKTAPWTSQANDITQTLSRYYSNTFSDAEKQHAMNLFLGLFIPLESPSPIWALTTDYHLHHNSDQALVPKNTPLTQWWDRHILNCLPLSYLYKHRPVKSVIPIPSLDKEWIDAYSDFYRPHEFIPLIEVYSFTVSHSVRDFAPSCVTDYSPFTVRVQPGRRREETGSLKNPSLTGHSSTSSTTSSGSSTQESDEDEVEDSRQSSPGKESSSSPLITFQSLFPSMAATYGTEIEYPKGKDLSLYKRYVFIGKNSKSPRQKNSSDPFCSAALGFSTLSSFDGDSSFQVKPPTVSEESLATYRAYVTRHVDSYECITPQLVEKYARYSHNELYQFSPGDWKS